MILFMHICIYVCIGLFIFDLIGDDFGSYTCVAENDYGRVEETMFIYGILYYY